MLIKETSAAKKLLWILFFSFLIRAILPVVAYIKSQDKQIFYAGDSSGYVQLAKELVETGHFAKGREPEIRRPPGYPLFLTAGVILDKIEAVTIFLQIIISCLTVFIIYKIASKLFNSHTCGLLSALLYSLEPLSIVFCSNILTETLFTFSTVLFIFFLVKYSQEERSKDLFFSALFLSLSIYVRPVSYYLVIPLSVGIFIHSYIKRHILMKSVLYGVAFVTICAISIGAWQVRNNKVAGFSRFSAEESRILYFYNAAAVEAVEENKSFYKVQKERGFKDKDQYFKRHPEQRSWSSAERFWFMKKEGLREIRENATIYLPIHINGMLRVLIDPGAIYYLKLLGLYPKQAGLLGEIIDKGLFPTVRVLIKEKPLVFLTNTFLGIIWLFYLILAIYALFNRELHSFCSISIIGIGVYFWITSGGPVALGRYRHPIMPIICVLASFTLNIIVKKYKIKHNKNK